MALSFQEARGCNYIWWAGRGGMGTGAGAGSEGGWRRAVIAPQAGCGLEASGCSSCGLGQSPVFSRPAALLRREQIQHIQSDAGAPVFGPQPDSPQQQEQPLHGEAEEAVLGWSGGEP